MLNFNVIIVTTDLSEYSLRALPYAVGLAERFKAKLKVVCVNEPALQVSDVAFVGVDPLISQREHGGAIRSRPRQEVPNGLELPDRLIELHPRSSVLDRLVQTCLRNSQRLGRNSDPPAVECCERYPKTTTSFTQQGVVRHDAILEHEFSS